MKSESHVAQAGECTIRGRAGRTFFLLVLVSVALIPTGCSQQPAPVAPVSEAQNTNAQVQQDQAVNSDPNSTPQQRQQEMRQIQAQQNLAPVAPVSVAQDSAAQTQAINNDPNASPQQRQQEMQRVQAQQRP